MPWKSSSRLLCDLRDSIFLFNKNLLVYYSCSLFFIFCKYFCDFPLSYREAEHTLTVGHPDGVHERNYKGWGMVTARSCQKGPVVTVPARDTEPSNSGGLGFVYILGTSCMPVPSGYWHTFNLASDHLGKLGGTFVSQPGGALS